MACCQLLALKIKSAKSEVMVMKLWDSVSRLLCSCVFKLLPLIFNLMFYSPCCHTLFKCLCLIIYNISKIFNPFLFKYYFLLTQNINFVWLPILLHSFFSINFPIIPLGYYFHLFHFIYFTPLLVLDWYFFEVLLGIFKWIRWLNNKQTEFHTVVWIASDFKI
jgi:hypothetical protein